MFIHIALKISNQQQHSLAGTQLRAQLEVVNHAKLARAKNTFALTAPEHQQKMTKTVLEKTHLKQTCAQALNVNFGARPRSVGLVDKARQRNAQGSDAATAGVRMILHPALAAVLKIQNQYLS